MNDLWNKILNWFAHSYAWKWISLNIMSHLTFRVFGYPTTPMETFFQIPPLDPNKCYAFTCHDSKCLAGISINVFTPGDMHTGFVEPGKDLASMQAIHMKGKGFTCNHPLNFIRESDRFRIIELDLEPHEAQAIKATLRDMASRRHEFVYDFAQSGIIGDNVLSCANFFYEVCLGYVDDPDLVLKKIAGRKIFTPEDVAKCGKIIYSYGYD